MLNCMDCVDLCESPKDFARGVLVYGGAPFFLSDFLGLCYLAIRDLGVSSRVA